MDLNFPPFDRTAEAPPPVELAALMHGVAVRQAGSITAGVQSGIRRDAAEPGRFAPADGRFSAAAADALAGWRDG